MEFSISLELYYNKTMNVMNKIKRTVLVVALVLMGSLSSVGFIGGAAHAGQVSASCSPNSRFLTFPLWYRGLDGADVCMPRIKNAGDIWRIGLNFVEMLIQAVAYVSAFFILWGGVQYVISLGEPDKISNAKSTITNAIIGLVIAIFAVAIVNFIAGIV